MVRAGPPGSALTAFTRCLSDSCRSRGRPVFGEPASEQHSGDGGETAVGSIYRRFGDAVTDAFQTHEALLRVVLLR